MEPKLIYREGLFNILIKAKFRELEFEDLDVWKLTDEILSYLPLQSQVSGKVGLDRERVAGELWFFEGGDRAPENEQVMIMEECYRRADFICAKFKTVDVPDTLLELTNEFHEINPNNYNDEDVRNLNAWGINIYKSIHALLVGRDK